MFTRMVIGTAVGSEENKSRGHLLSVQSSVATLALELSHQSDVCQYHRSTKVPVGEKAEDLAEAEEWVLAKD